MDEGQRITDEINADPEESAKLWRAIEDADAGKGRPHTRVLRDVKIYSLGLVMHPLPHLELYFTDRSPHAIFERCPQCEGEMRQEHAHYRCVGCGFKDHCCD